MTIIKPIDNACVEKITEILGELVTGSEITKILAKHNWKEHDTENGVRCNSTKPKRIESSLLYEMSKYQSPNPFFQLIQYTFRLIPTGILKEFS